MVCYVDDMYKYPMGEFRPRGVVRVYKMSHMIADTDEELHAMADRIGVARRWFQGDHYDVTMTKRAEALKAGAVAITLQECSKMAVHRRRHGGPLQREAVNGAD